MWKVTGLKSSHQKTDCGENFEKKLSDCKANSRADCSLNNSRSGHSTK